MRDTVLELGRDLALGQSATGECPECGHRKFSVTRYSDGYGWLCWRASCGVRGAIGTGVAGTTTAVPTPPPFVPRPCPYELGPIEGYAEERLGYCGGSPFPWASYSSGPDRIVFFLDDLDFKPRGWASRTRSKYITSGKTRPGPLYGYYNDTAGDPPTLWLVEDCLSAIRLAQEGEAALALLGTRLDVAILDELWDAYPNCRRIYVALDPGAEDAAREIVRQCRDLRGLDAIQVPLPDDIHRLDQDTLTRLLETYA